MFPRGDRIVIRLAASTAIGSHVSDGEPCDLFIIRKDLVADRALVGKATICTTHGLRSSNTMITIVATESCVLVPSGHGTVETFVTLAAHKGRKQKRRRNGNGSSHRVIQKRLDRLLVYVNVWIWHDDSG